MFTRLHGLEIAKKRNSRIGVQVCRLTSFLTIAALALVLAASATATGPNTTVVTLHETNVFGPATAACGFPVDLRVDGSFKDTLFFNDSGMLVKLIETPFGGPFTLTAVNPATGKSVTTQTQAEPIVITFAPDGSIASVKQNGIIFNFVVPGAGAVLQSVGRIVIDADGNRTFVAGPKDFATQTISAFCNYLARA
jgi:hypothetical protein